MEQALENVSAAVTKHLAAFLTPLGYKQKQATLKKLCDDGSVAIVEVQKSAAARPHGKVLHQRVIYAGRHA